jgi:tRNA dimethylallyltransferase
MSTRAAGKEGAFAAREAPGGTLIVIGGTTASGKSALALRLAERMGATVVNADSQQLFVDLPILTARPTVLDERRADHRLYGILAADEQPSLGRWLALVAPILRETMAAGRAAVLVGGSGLYLEALLQGVAEVPDVPEEVRSRLRAWAAGRPAVELHERLAAVDPEAASRLRSSDPQRLLRALEVMEATGRPLAEWQRQGHRRIGLPERRMGLALMPPATVVRERVERRLAAMLADGARAEVEAALARRSTLAELPIAKVHGCRELVAVATGKIDEGVAIERIGAQVRQYAKRQRTFLRHRLPQLVSLEGAGDALDADEALIRMAPLG